jgi:hydrogenase nickel incorporation protein HypB
MCQNCGCDPANSLAVPGETESYHHSHSHSVTKNGEGNHLEHLHHHPSRTVAVGERLLSKNERFALRNRQWFQSHHWLVLNILSSPGSGKTALIERMAKELGDLAHPVGAIVGDLATDNDAQRLQAAGAAAVQITTGTTCHLDAEMVFEGVKRLNGAELDILIIENVGNLVCPAAYDLGESLRVVLLSVAEGEDKPLKYPTVFQSTDVVIISKIDLAEAVGFDRTTAIANIRRMAPQAKLFEVSARTGVGMEAWLDYLHENKGSFGKMG